MAAKNKHVLEVKNLIKNYNIEQGIMKKIVGTVHAVNDVSLYIDENETLGLVGESGCGKTTLGRCILRAIEPTSGKVVFNIDGKEIDLISLDQKDLREMRKHIQMVFQNPYSSLDPRMTIFDIISEPLRLLTDMGKDEIMERVKNLMDLVGLEIKHLNRFPYAFSGGQRQRIGIARALSINPEFIVADEPVSALDVSIQAQILNLMMDLQKKFNLATLFISHDLSIIEHVCDRVCIMYLGRVVELAETQDLYLGPRHPYTEALLSAIPSADNTKRIILSGEAMNAAKEIKGCCFSERCRYATDECKNTAPEMHEITPAHFVACHKASELQLEGVVPKTAMV